MIQTSLFGDLEAAPVLAPSPRVVVLCPACKCCDQVDGLCLGDCSTNLHRINRNGTAPQFGGWVDIESALNAPYPDTITDDDDTDEEADALGR